MTPDNGGSRKLAVRPFRSDALGSEPSPDSFHWGGIYVNTGGLDIEYLIKIPLIAFHLQFGGFVLCWWG